MTPAGIEPAAFRFVAQHLNLCATAVPYVIRMVKLRGVRRKGIGVAISACRMLDEECKGMSLLGSTDIDGRIILK